MRLSTAPGARSLASSGVTKQQGEPVERSVRVEQATPQTNGQAPRSGSPAGAIMSAGVLSPEGTHELAS